MANNFYFTIDESNNFLNFPWCFILDLVKDFKNQVITDTRKTKPNKIYYQYMANSN